MARETMAAKRARLEAERLHEQAKMAMAFPSNLLVALQGAAKFGFETEFANGNLNVVNRNTNVTVAFSLTASSNALQVEWSEENQEELYTLEAEVEHLAEQQRERERLQALRDRALAKLTDAERAVLGL